MSGDNKTLSGILLGILSNAALAFALAFVAKYLFLGLGASTDATLAACLVIFFSVFYVDPIELWRNDKPLWTILAKMAVGLVFGAIVVAILPERGGLDPQTPGLPDQPAPEKEPKSIGGLLLFMLPLMLIVPLTFFAPILEKLISNRNTPSASEDAKIGAVFPIYVTFTMFLNLAIPGALFLLGASPMVAMAVFMAGVLIAVTEVWYAAPEDLVDDIDREEWGPRPKTSAKAFDGLKRAMRNSFSGALFIGSMIYISIQAALPIDIDAFGGHAGGLAFLWTVIKAALVVLASFLCLTVVGLMILSAAVFVLMRMKGLHPLSGVELLKQASSRLFVGGMHWVRPDLDDDP